MNELSLALRDLDEKRVYELVEKELAAGASAIDIINSCNEGMVAAGELFSQGTYFISELIFSAEILKEIMKRIEPLMQTAPAGAGRGKVVIGTVKGDIHDIGKNIVATLLRGSGFEVTDLGVDVPAEKFVEALEQSGAKVLGMSALLNVVNGSGMAQLPLTAAGVASTSGRGSLTTPAMAVAVAPTATGARSTARPRR